MSTSFKATNILSAIKADAKAIVGAFASLDKAASKTRDTVSAHINHMISVAREGGLKAEEPSVKWLQQTIKDAFAEAIAVGMMEAKTVTEYAQGAARAFVHNVEWTPTLKNDPTMALPWSASKVKAKAAPAEGATEVDGETTAKGKQKPGKVKAVSKEDAFATARTLLAQLRALNLSSVAADILDDMLEVEGFSETV